jgi:hypothetical protein
MAKPDELTLDTDQVRAEHLKDVNERAQWTYLFGVLIGGFILMILLIAIVSGGGS